MFFKKLIVSTYSFSIKFDDFKQWGGERTGFYDGRVKLIGRKQKPVESHRLFHLLFMSHFLALTYFMCRFRFPHSYVDRMGRWVTSPLKLSCPRWEKETRKPFQCVEFVGKPKCTKLDCGIKKRHVTLFTEKIDLFHSVRWACSARVS